MRATCFCQLSHKRVFIWSILWCFLLLLLAFCSVSTLYCTLSSQATWPPLSTFLSHARDIYWIFMKGEENNLWAAALLKKVYYRHSVEQIIRKLLENYSTIRLFLRWVPMYHARDIYWIFMKGEENNLWAARRLF
jgi:hypothetical protein